MLFLLTADWQLGLTQRHLGTHASLLSEARFETVRRVIDLAVERSVDAVLVAGDIFEDSDVDSRTVESCVEILEKAAPTPVLLLPGNHDPQIAGGVWDRDLWVRGGAHVRVLLEPREIEVAGAAIYPCPLTQKKSRQDPTDWIPGRVKGDRRPRVALAHGSLGILEHQANFPIALDRVDRAGLDFLALGDWHGLKTGDRWAYPGTPEPTSFSEREAGHVLLIELEQAGSLPRIESIKVSGHDWCALQIDVRDSTDLEELEQRVKEASTDPSRLLLRVGGEVGGDSEIGDRLEAFRQRLEARVCYLDWRFEEATTGPLDWPPGMIEAIAGALETAEGGGSMPAPFDAIEVAGPEEALRARELLARLIRGVA